MQEKPGWFSLLIFSLHREGKARPRSLEHPEEGQWAEWRWLALPPPRWQPSALLPGGAACPEAPSQMPEVSMVLPDTPRRSVDLSATVPRQPLTISSKV